MSLKSSVLISVLVFAILSIFLLIQHETQMSHLTTGTSSMKQVLLDKAAEGERVHKRTKNGLRTNRGDIPILYKRQPLEERYPSDVKGAEELAERHESVKHIPPSDLSKAKSGKLEEVPLEEIETEHQFMAEVDEIDDIEQNDDDDDSIFNVLDEDDQNKEKKTGLETYADDDDDNVGKDPVDLILAKLDDEVQQKEASKKAVGGNTGSSAIISDRKITPLARENPSGTLPPPSIDLSEIDGEDDGNSTEKLGKLFCDGKQVDSEVIYWRDVPGDSEFESPITPHHDNHHDRYITFEYDNGGWNNVRMSLECIIVIAHAMGRTLVIPPQQHLYLLGKTHKDEEDTKAHDEMGFEDFFDIELLKSHRGFHTITMKEFLEAEACQGGLGSLTKGNKGMLPKNNNSELWGQDLWWYLNNVADYTPEWAGRFMAFPDRPGDFNLTRVHHPRFQERIKAFGGERTPVFYDEIMQRMHHIHIPGDSNHRVLQHHYAFAYFASPVMQSFYRRFVRDYMRYKDEIHCMGAAIIAAVREDSLRENPQGGGAYYALHIRRGDFQFKEVKIGADEIVKNLDFNGPDGKPLIPKGAIVYVSTDDPKGICENCLVQRIPCDKYEKGKKPPGCPEDPSWNAFIKAGWKIRFLQDYEKKGHLEGVNPNLFGMIESIVCSRAKVFAGTYFSTFTGYIHRLRGFHGLGEATYYHSTQFIHHLQMRKSVGHGFSREWRTGWTDDQGEPI